jgi:predicted nucleic acid-binding protein
MLYLLDTNVVSELRKVRTAKADKRVAKWADSVSAVDLYLSAISVQELETGVQLIERKDKAQGRLLRAWLEGHVLPAFAGRILPVDETVARRCAALHVPNPAPVRDSLIAATGLVHGMTVVTRNVSDFEAMGVTLLNPWLK